MPMEVDQGGGDNVHVLELGGAGDDLYTIPTYDASDVDHHLAASDAERLFGKWKIMIAAYDPLPMVRLALIQAHASEEPSSASPTRRKRTLSRDSGCTRDLVQDIKAELANAEIARWPGERTRPRRHDLLICNLPHAIQHAFRQNVLRLLALYVASLASAVVAGLLLIPWSRVQDVKSQIPQLFPVLGAGAVAMLVLLLCLLHALRCDHPVNLGVLAFVAGCEVISAILWGVVSDPHIAAAACSMAASSVVLFYGFSTRLTISATTGEAELPRLITSSVESALVLAGVALPLNVIIGVHVTHMPMATMLLVLVAITLGLVWVAIVLAVLSQTAIPEEYSNALVFFHSDLVTVAIAMPVQAVWQRLIRCVRAWRPWRTRSNERACGKGSHSPRASTGHSPKVVAAASPVKQSIENRAAAQDKPAFDPTLAGSDDEATDCGSSRGAMHSMEVVIVGSDGAWGSATSTTVVVPRRRNSISD